MNPAAPHSATQHDTTQRNAVFSCFGFPLNAYPLRGAPYRISPQRPSPQRDNSFVNLPTPPRYASQLGAALRFTAQRFICRFTRRIATLRDTALHNATFLGSQGKPDDKTEL